MYKFTLDFTFGSPSTTRREYLRTGWTNIWGMFDPILKWRVTNLLLKISTPSLILIQYLSTLSSYPLLRNHSYFYRLQRNIFMSADTESVQSDNVTICTVYRLGCPQILLRSETEAKQSETFFREIAKLTPQFRLFRFEAKQEF